jgi:hypothetical protein
MTRRVARLNVAGERAARAWCQMLARALAVQRIDRNGRPYLERYFAAGWSPTNTRSGPAIFLHHFVASDDADQVHSHPWGWSASLILAGGYREERCGPDNTIVAREYRPGDVNVLEADARHRIDLLAEDCWTVFLAGEYAQPWAFTPSCGGDR